MGVEGVICLGNIEREPRSVVQEQFKTAVVVSTKDAPIGDLIATDDATELTMVGYQILGKITERGLGFHEFSQMADALKKHLHTEPLRGMNLMLLRLVDEQRDDRSPLETRAEFPSA